MKNLKMVLSGFALVAIVSGALAFKAYTNPNVFCLASGQTTGACPAADLVNYKTDVNGFVTAPCTGTNVPHTTQVIAGTTVCANSPITTFTAEN